MNYTVSVYYTNSTTVRRFNAENLTKAWQIVDREKHNRFVRMIELTVLLQTWVIQSR